MLRIEIKANQAYYQGIKEACICDCVKLNNMKQYDHFFGVDVSKKTVDITLAHNEGFAHRQFTNDDEGMNQLMDWLTEINPAFENTLFCIEATGLYCFPLTRFLAANSIDIWIEHAAQIRKATAMARGKNDKVDSQRIVVYASKYLERLRLWRPMDATLEKIRHLASLRERLVETKRKLETPIHEFTEMGNISMAKLLTKSIKTSLGVIDKDLKNIEAKIIAIVNDDDNLKLLFKIITSVVGIGFVTAINLLVHTYGFTMLKDTRKLACNCGVAPFEYSSGTSLKFKPRVHYMCNKKSNVTYTWPL